MCTTIMGMKKFLPAVVAAIISLTLCADRGATAPQGSPAGARQDEAPGAGSAPPPPLPGGSVLGLGDRLKISFFEMIDVASDGSRARSDSVRSRALHTFYQRMDLSGEYAIEQDGTISFPRLGRFAAEGRSLRDLQTELAAAFLRAMAQPADVNITIVDRSPIYVVGPVKNPGAYKHVPGMIVLQALALAGGFEQALGNASNLIEGVREMERLRKAADQLKRLLARHARLEAERDGADTLQPPPQLIALAGDGGAQEFLAPEVAILRVEQARRQQKKTALIAAADAARSELEALKGKLAQAEVQREIRDERLNDLRTLKERGVATSNNVIIMRSELSDIEARRQDLLLAQVQVQARLAQAEQAKAQFESEDAANLIKAIAATDQELAEAQQSVASGEVLAPVIDIRARLSANSVTYEIVRQTRDGPTVLEAKDTSSLTPGDVLKIGIKASVAQHGSGTRLGGALPSGIAAASP